MERNEWIKVGCIVGGVMSLGLVTYLLLKKEEDRMAQALADSRRPDEADPPEETPIEEPKKVGWPSQAKQAEAPTQPVVAVAVTPSPEKAQAAASPLKETEPMQETHVVEPESEPEPKPEPAPAPKKEGALQPPKADEFPLRVGSCGERVERLKVWLMRNYGWFGKITPTYDARTQERVKKYLGSEQVDEATYTGYRMGNHVNEQVIIRA